MPTTQHRLTSRPGRSSILIVDDHPLIRGGLASLVRGEQDLAICQASVTRESACAVIATQRPDLVIVELEFDGRDGLDLLKEIKTRHPEAPMLVLSTRDEGLYAERCLRAGAAGYVSKRATGATVLAAIRRVLAGDIYMSAMLVARLAAQYVGGGTLATNSPCERLSDRELEVFRLIGRGRTTRQIAGALVLSIKTVESYRAHIKRKLTIGSAAELVQRATLWVGAIG